MPSGEHAPTSSSHLGAVREALAERARGAVDSSGLCQAVRGLGQLWLARTRQGWRHERGDDGARLVVVGLDANSIAFFGDPVAVPTNEALLQVFAGAAGVLLDPRGRHPTALGLREIYAITGKPGVVHYTGAPLRARTHGEVHLYLDGIGWPPGWRGHRLLEVDGQELNEYRTDGGAPPGAPSVVRFIVEEHMPSDDFGTGTSQLIDGVGWIVEADLERAAIAKDNCLFLVDAERVFDRARRVVDLLERALRSRGSEANLFTPLSQLAAELAPDRLSFAGLDRECAAARAQHDAMVQVVARERDMGDPLEQRAEHRRVSIVTRSSPFSTHASLEDTLARAHLIERSQHALVMQAALEEVLRTVHPYGDELPVEVLSALTRAALAALQSPAVMVVDRAFDLVQGLAAQGLSSNDGLTPTPEHEALRSGLLALLDHRDHVHFRSRLLELICRVPGSDDHAATQEALSRLLQAEEPRLLALALRSVSTPTKLVLRRATELLAHGAPEVRAEAIALLGRGDEPAAVAHVARFLDDEHGVLAESVHGWLGTTHRTDRTYPVQVRAVYSLSDLSRLTRTKFDVPVGFADTPDSLEKWVDEAKRWHESVRIWL